MKHTASIASVAIAADYIASFAIKKRSLLCKMAFIIFALILIRYTTDVMSLSQCVCVCVYLCVCVCVWVGVCVCEQ